MHSTIEEKIMVVAEAAEAAGVKQAARTAQLEAVKQQLKSEQESRINQVLLQAAGRPSTHSDLCTAMH